MNINEIRGNMTEAALSVECVMRGYPRISLKELSEACFLSQAAVEFIIEQMICFGVAKRSGSGRYSLTDEYKLATF
ncbi:TPA: hypothetical protein N7D54_002393 [Escherichia coli]|uniref:hypothetical protein n=1 Tax=Escherichia coli TaxID=562 RepID=UPI00111AD5C4|nr:hypothetical protein [Escherichia coli]EFL4479800.1 hypothetical protein [Escherichia fergusonii]EFX5115431.1 hypothetical protein [Shigella sonnei]EFX6827851.1 hypothetical protein [Shigella sonnei]EFX7621053.1 hypothetical protein [Shigella sonnei]EFY0734376.1 hypothetical protein [Shigella sonnei]